MPPDINTHTVMSAIYALHGRHARWPTKFEIAAYLEVDETVVTPLLKELKDARLYRSRQRQRRTVWMPWEEA